MFQIQKALEDEQTQNLLIKNGQINAKKSNSGLDGLFFTG
ncbi:unnamed protein product, partial [marine sediment metagenome]